MSILHRLTPRTTQLAGTTIARMLPKRECRKVGPWVFIDRFGPVTGLATADHDIGPHPHIGLSTVSFLLEGCIEHRDSTGGHAIVRANEVHWMRAGHGIVHSERTPKGLLTGPFRSTEEQTRYGLQLWCAHPDGEEEQEPRFDSYRELPELTLAGSRVQLLAGTGWNEASPVDVTSPLIYALAHLDAGASIPLPDHEERGIYPLSGEISVDGERSTEDLLVLDRAATTLHAIRPSVVAILGGDAIGPRHMWWNFVHSSQARIDEQAVRWKQGDFPQIPGDPA